MIALLFLERNCDVPITPQEEAGLTLILDRNPRGPCHYPKDTDFPIHLTKGLMPLNRVEWNLSIKSQHEGEPTAQLHPPEKSHRFQIQLDKRPDTPFQLERQAKFHASTQDQDCLPCSTFTETPRSMSEMERNPEVPATTRDEVLLIPAAIRYES